MALASVNDWSDFQERFLDTYIPQQTVATLRVFGDIIQAQTGAYLGIRSSERKADLVSKITHAFQSLKKTNDFARYKSVREECERRGKPMSGYPSRYLAPPQPAPTFGGVPHSNGYASGSNYRPNGYTGYAAGPSTGWNRAESSTNVYSAPRQNITLVDWKPNPMWKAIQAVTNMESLPDIHHTDGSHTRRERKVHFQLPQEVCDRLRQTKNDPTSSPQYSLRLFCTSSDYFRPPNAPYSSLTANISNRAIPIEYPLAPDIRVDDFAIQFKERGLRGKSGSAPPFDLSKTARGLVLEPARMASVLFGHTGPTVGKKKDQAKKFYFQVALVEWTPKDALLRRLNELPVTDAQKCIDMNKHSLDDDIEVGSSKLNLKDPLSYMRITKPVRSAKCRHMQCFEPQWWIESNSVHPQWLCPLCHKELLFQDLIVDGYFLSILNAVPESVDEVVVESDFSWRTEDNKFGSKGTGESSSSRIAEPLNLSTNNDMERKPSLSTRPNSPSPDSKGKRKAIEILSSDDEDEPLSRTNGTSSLAPSLRPSVAPRHPSANGTSSSRPSVPPINNDVIDLTLSDSDDDESHTRDPAPSVNPSNLSPTHSKDVQTNGNETDEEDFSQPPFPRPDADRLNAARDALSPPRLPPYRPLAPMSIPPMMTTTMRTTTERNGDERGIDIGGPGSESGGTSKSSTSRLFDTYKERDGSEDRNGRDILDDVAYGPGSATYRDLNKSRSSSWRNPLLRESYVPKDISTSHRTDQRGASRNRAREEEYDVYWDDWADDFGYRENRIDDRYRVSSSPDAFSSHQLPTETTTLPTITELPASFAQAQLDHPSRLITPSPPRRIMTPLTGGTDKSSKSDEIWYTPPSRPNSGLMDAMMTGKSRTIGTHTSLDDVIHARATKASLPSLNGFEPDHGRSEDFSKAGESLDLDRRTRDKSRLPSLGLTALRRPSSMTWENPLSSL